MYLKIALTLITLILMVTVTGCNAVDPDSSASSENSQQSSPDSESESKPGENQQLLPFIAGKGIKLQLDETSDGSVQQLSVEDIMAVTLESNPSTGYGWFAASSNPDVVAQTGENQYEAPSSSTNEPVVGAPGKETIYLKATSAGTATITLEYKRGWETDVSPEKTLTITVEVK
jgi:inhibitor of cysteine peptidase